jgi:hypothetical protein
VFIGETGLSRAIKRTLEFMAELGADDSAHTFSEQPSTVAVRRSIAPKPALHSRHETRG